MNTTGGALARWSIALLRKADRTTGRDPLYPPIEVPAVMHGTYYHGVSRGAWRTLFAATEMGDVEAISLSEQLLASSTVQMPYWTTSSSLIGLVTDNYCSDAEELCLCCDIGCDLPTCYVPTQSYGIDILDPVFGSPIAFGPFIDPELFDRCSQLLNKFGLLKRATDVSSFLELYRGRSTERELEPLSDGSLLRPVIVTRLFMK